MRKFWLPFFCALSFFTSNAFATTNHVFFQGLSVEYELPVNDPQIFSNIFFWTVKASCTIISGTPENPFNVTMLRKTGSVNEIMLTSGDSMDIVVQLGDKLNITAVSGAKVELVNHGNTSVKASCSTV